jgi:hypothetical protein
MESLPPDSDTNTDETDFESGSSTIFCRIFFAEQFAALRLACDCEDSFVESLARCVAFDAAGGKSGSAFLKTKGGCLLLLHFLHADHQTTDSSPRRYRG